MHKTSINQGSVLDNVVELTLLMQLRRCSLPLPKNPVPALGLPVPDLDLRLNGPYHLLCIVPSPPHKILILVHGDACKCTEFNKCVSVCCIAYRLVKQLFEHAASQPCQSVSVLNTVLLLLFYVCWLYWLLSDIQCTIHFAGMYTSYLSCLNVIKNLVALCSSVKMSQHYQSSSWCLFAINSAQYSNNM